MSYVEYQLAKSRRGEMMREASNRRRAGEAASYVRRTAAPAHVVGGAIRRLSRVAAVRMAP